MRARGLFFLFILFMLLINTTYAVECPPGFRWDRMSGVGCVQADCNEVSPQNSHWGYTGNCICGTDDCVGNPVCVECYAPVDYGGFDKKKCEVFCPNVKLVACVKANTPCPGEKPTSTVTKATTTTTKTAATATTTTPQKGGTQNVSSDLSRLFDENFFNPPGGRVAQAGFGTSLGNFLDRTGNWLREGWRRIVPDQIIRVEDSDAWREWIIVGSDGSHVRVKIGGGEFDASMDGIKIKLKPIEVDTGSGSKYIKGFKIGEIGVEQSFKAEDIAADKIKDKLTEDVPETPVSPDINWDAIKQDIEDFFDKIKREAADAVPEGLKDAYDKTKHLTGGGN